MGLRDNLRELEAVRRLLDAAEESAAFGRRIRQARKGRGLTLEDLSGATGIAKSYLSQIETGYAPPPRDDKVERIAEALGLGAKALVEQAHLAQLPEDVRERMARLRSVFDSTEELIRALVAVREAAPAAAPDAGRGAADARAEVHGAERPPAAERADSGDDADAGRGEAGEAEAPLGALGRRLGGIDLDALHRSGLLRELADWGDARADQRLGLRQIPVINKVAAGYGQEFTDLGYPVGMADEYIAAPADLDDPNAFGVRVYGDSMEPRYHEGDVVIVSPAREVRSGDDCFVRYTRPRRPGEHEATFKRVFFDPDDTIRLQPLNERHAPVLLAASDVQAVFRVIARWEHLD
jgi:transcriptional regulator with XRE-family HTH domain/SOS-response transcriptional repressor LexA